MRVKIAKCFATFALAASMCFAPFAQAAYANTAVLTAGGTALATVLAAYGINVANSDGTLDPAKLWTTWTGFLDDVTSDMVAEARSAAIASNPDYFNNVLAWDQGGREKIEADFIDWGQTGTIPLDAIGIAQSGALGLLPFLLSLFIADQVGSSSTADIPSFMLGDVKISLAYSGDTIPGLGGRYNKHQYSSAAYAYYADYGVWTILYGDGSSNPESSGKVMLSVDANKRFYFGRWSSYSRVWPEGSENQYDFLNYNRDLALSLDLQYRYLDDISTIWLKPGCSLYIQDTYGYLTGERYALVPVYDPAAGGWNTSIGTVTDNPDVNLGHDYWDDAKDRVDVLNPAAGAAVIGADAVIDGDYIANRGSLGVITDWADINSWADALARAHAGVAEGALDGTISGTATGTAVNVGTGELVTDAVGELVKPDAGTSLSPSKDFDWGKFLDPSLYLVFPFCLPWDLVELVKTLSAEPQAPVIDWPMPSLTGQQNLHVDLSPWSPVAAVLRAGELMVAAVGLIWITKTMIRN
ncbi:MAG: hypothetical protein ACLVKI_06770 [Gordonibacter urolithinfaciens]